MVYKDKDKEKAYLEKNKDKIKQQMKDYTLKNKEKKRLYDIEYRKKNREKKKQQDRNWYVNNKDHRKEYDLIPHVLENRKAWTKQYRKTYNGIKSMRLGNWKSSGIIFDDFDWLYDLYINCSKCDFCKKDFKDSYERCLDHDHDVHDYNNVRGILCRGCNTKDVLNPLK